jgi:hypothetical protein
MTSQDLHVLLRKEGESWPQFQKRVSGSKGELLVVLSTDDQTLLLKDDAAKRTFMSVCETLHERLTVAMKESTLVQEARRLHIRVCNRVSALKGLLHDHPQAEEVVRVFSPHIWQQELRSRLQAVGLLSMPKLRIWVLVGTSIFLFLFVILRLLPSAEVLIWPRQESVSQTVNVYLYQSGAQIPAPDTVRRVPLVPITVEVQRSITFDQIHREFTGRSAVTTMQVFNTTNEEVSLREGSRLVSSGSGGIVFRLRDPVVIQPKSTTTVTAAAEDHDLFGAIIGDRGNVQAGLRWEFPGLDETDRELIYAKNTTAGRGGTSSSRLVLRQEDLQFAEKQLHRELVATAQEMIRDRLFELNEKYPTRSYEAFDDLSLIRAIFHDVHLPTEFIGEAVGSVPVDGSVTYTVLAYDTSEILDMLHEDLIRHIEEGKALVEESVSLPSLKLFVVKWDDSFTWVKVTAELSATERFVLDPLTANGAKFSRRVREEIAGMTLEDALKVVKNMSEVERAEIKLWPPWNTLVTSIPANISVEQQ